MVTKEQLIGFEDKYKHSEITKQKIGLSKKGKIFPKLSESLKNTFKRGRITWNKGKHYKIESYNLSPEKRKVRINNLGNKFVGRKHSEETKKKQSISKLGNKNPSYIHGRSKREYPDIFYKIRNSRIIHKRDNYTCQLCKEIIIKSTKKDKKKLTLHHIDYNPNNNSLNNLIILCSVCNVLVNKNREDWKKFFMEKINAI